MNDMAPVGLFFGSFNPVHNGHLAIARYLLEAGHCREVWFVISPRNPWKEDRELLDEAKRLEMVEAALAEETRMRACDVEFTMPRPSYTYQTLRVLKERFPDERFALIIGGDNLERFHCWKNYREILSHHPVLVYPRPGVEVSPQTEAGITLVNAPLMTVSSTAIRRLAQEGKAVAEEVPPAVSALVEKYYGKNNLEN